MIRSRNAIEIPFNVDDREENDCSQHFAFSFWEGLVIIWVVKRRCGTCYLLRQLRKRQSS